ncbi:MAG: hypothetical protein KDD94_09695, partial [Calditrichaeota bacterium]|nr:hypothetical protein [Calditrichota bacterium]
MDKQLNYLVNRYQQHIDRLQQILSKLSNLRIASFLMLLAFMFLSIQNQLFSLIVIAALVSFIFWVKRYQFYERKRRFYQAKQNYCRMNLKRLNGEWKQFDYSNKKLQFRQSHISLDMDIFGDQSLYKYLWINASRAGDQRLADNLAVNQPLPKLAEIQDAVRELKNMEYLRSTILAKIHSENLDQFDVRKFVNWLNKPLALERTDRYLAWSPLVMISLFVLSALFSGIGLAVAFLFIQFAIVLFRQSAWIGLYEDVLEKNKVFFAYRDILQLVARQSFKSKKLSDIHSQFNRSDQDIFRGFTAFQKLINKLSLRYSDVAHNTMNSLFMWDIWTIKNLIRWQNKYKQQVPVWFDQLTEIEFLLALSNYYRLNPSYNFADLSGNSLQLKQLGHPLISENSRICNDFEIEPGQIAIITGSNMAGKTTFLRTVAINLVLAYCGAPVCAESFASPVLILESSIKISDSLSDGVSFFYAEVKRLKEIVDCLKHNEYVIFFV